MKTQTESEIILSHQSERALVSNFGASLREYYLLQADGKQLPFLWGYRGASNKEGGQGDVLAPFPGRLRNGRYRFGSQSFQIEINDKSGPNAIHGFLRNVLWKIEEQTENRAVFSFRIEPSSFPGYPFSLTFQIAYSLTASGLETTYNIQNHSNTPAPAGIGFHPYFTVGNSLIDETLLQIPASKLFEFDSGLLPTGGIQEVSSTGVDFRAMRQVGPCQIDHCFTNMIRDERGYARAIIENRSDLRRIVITMDRTFDFLVVYTGDQLSFKSRRKTIAIEPLTCATDAFNKESYNSPSQWGEIILHPQQVRTGHYFISHEFINRA
jgi:aldose 1-epimerase